MKYSSIALIGNGTTIICAALSTNEIAQLILYILGIVGAIFSLTMNIVSWFQKAKKDGKITKEEIKEGVDIISDGVKDINDKIKKEDK